MRNDSLTIRGFTFKLVLLLLLLFVVFSALSGLLVYFRTYAELGDDYGSAISAIRHVRDSLMVETIRINIVFFFLIVSGVIIIGIIYTHRIAGPLYRIRMFAREVADGDLSGTLRFRKKDAVHPLADSLNTLSGNYRHRLTSLDADLKRVKKKITELNGSKNEDISDILEIDRKIRKDLKNLNQ